MSLAKKVLNFIYPFSKQEDVEHKALKNLPVLKDKFTNIYNNNLFAGRKSRSGEGSDHIQTAIIRREIPRLIQEYNIKTFLDAPCGDWYWMSQTPLEVEKYIGVDIVQPLIDRNTQLYGNETTIFDCLNLTTDILPSVDLIFSRDCLVHLTYEDAFRVIRNFKNSGSKYLLTTTFTDRKSNLDQISDNNFSVFWQPLNLQKKPFNFPQPLVLINEGCTEGKNAFTDKCLGLWLLSEITLP